MSNPENVNPDFSDLADIGLGGPAPANDNEILPGLTAQGCAVYALFNKQQAHPFEHIASVTDAEVETWIAETRLRLAAEKPRTPIELDQPANIEWAKDFLEHDAPTAIEGQGGELTTLSPVAGRLKDHAISEGTALQLMLDHWNDRQQPPWEFEGLRIKVRNAFLYCKQTVPGSATAEADFADLPAPDLTALIALDAKRDIAAMRRAMAGKAEPPPVYKPTPYVALDATKIPPRDWLYGQQYIRRKVSADFAPGAAGKTSNKIVEIISMASGVDLLDVGDSKMYGRPLKVWYINLEEDRDELNTRVAAAIKHYSTGWAASERGPGRIAPLDAAALKLLTENLFINSGEEIPLKIAYEKNKEFSIAVPVVEAMIAAAKANQIDVISIDPFVSSHSIGENNNAQIDAVIKDGYKKIAERSDCGVDLSHHTRKIKGDEYDIADARGASALVDAVRVARVYNIMSVDEAKEFGITADEREQYFRMTNGKPNMQRRGGAPQWRHIIGVSLDNAQDGRPADDVGVVTAFHAPQKTPEQKEIEADNLSTAILAFIDDHEQRLVSGHGGGGSCSVKKFAAKQHTSTKIVEAALDRLIDAKVIKYRTNLAGGHGQAGYYRLQP